MPRALEAALAATMMALPAFVLTSLPASAAGPALIGLWLTEEGDSRIKVAPCGPAFCATIVWVKADAKDEHNPDPALRKRGLVGLPLSEDMRAQGRNRWEGSIYNPENGKTYAVSMKAKGGDKLEVEGCVMGVLCGSETWSRLPDETASIAPAPRP